MAWLKEIAKKPTLSAADKTKAATLNALAPKPFYIWRLETPDEKILCTDQKKTAEKYGLNVGNLGSVLHKRVLHKRKTAPRGSRRGSVIKSVNGYGAAFVEE